MIVYRELDPMAEHITQFAFKGQRQEGTYSQAQHAKYGISKSTY